MKNGTSKWKSHSRIGSEDAGRATLALLEAALLERFVQSGELSSDRALSVVMPASRYITTGDRLLVRLDQSLGTLPRDHQVEDEPTMNIRLDHVVLWVDEPLRAVDFYERVVGLPGLRVEEFRAGSAPFPSVRISEDSILDLMPRRANASGASAGHPVNHVCLAMSREDFELLRGRLAKNEVEISAELERSFGARGLAPHTYYFADPDGNVIEARYY